jgi:hypothetical protein
MTDCGSFADWEILFICGIALFSVVTVIAVSLWGGR